MSEDLSPSFIIQKIRHITEVSAKIRDARNVMIELDNERQKYRESARKIEQEDIDPVWVMNGTTYIKTSQKNCLSILKHDSEVLEKATHDLTEIIKLDTDTYLKLKDMKSLEDRGFKLKPLVVDGKLNEN